MQQASEGGAAPLSPGLREAVELVRTDREHGASWLARAAAEALEAVCAGATGASAAARLDDAHRAAQAFANARPAMAAVANTVARIWQATTHASSDVPQDHLLALAHEAGALVARWDAAAAAIATSAGVLLGATVFTHGRSATVEATLTAPAWRTGEGRRVIVTESRPGAEGVALARALAQSGIAVTLVPDAAAGVWVAQADAVVVGADTVRADGAVVNKVGTSLVALAAQAASVPLYVLCESLKIAPPATPIQFEEAEFDVLGPDAPHGIQQRSVLFDLTPASMVSALITEEGVLSLAQIADFAVEAQSWRVALLRPYNAELPDAEGGPSATSSARA